MKRMLGTFLPLLLSLVPVVVLGCSSSADVDVDMEEGALTGADVAARGLRQVRVAVGGDRPDELCVLPKKAPGAAHYYRIQGPTFLIEYDNSQNNANHQHIVWRDFKGDFGDDLLAAHYAAAPHQR